jgi:hypothetical protein
MKLGGEMVKKIRLSCVEGTIHPKLLKGPFILSFVEERPLGERTGEGELRVVIDCPIPLSKHGARVDGMNFEVEMWALNRPRR